MKTIWIARATLVVLAPVLSFVLLEGFLRLVWVNPYTPSPPVDRYQSRLGDAWWRASAYTGGLYEGGDYIQGVRTRFRSLSSGGPDRETPVIALGGSTTEAVLVPQGERWPDLLHPPAMNYGTAENSVIDSYRNLDLLLNGINLRPQRILLMHAVNDLTEILRAPDHFGIDLLPHRPIHNPLEAEAAQRVLGIRVRDSWLLSFISFQFYESVGRDLTRAAPPVVLPPDAVFLEEPQIQALADYVRTLLPARREAIEAIHQLAVANGAELVLLTQPHAMRPDYEPYSVERRMMRTFRSQWMAHQDDAMLLGIMNDHTRQVANDLGLPLVDVDRCFESLNPTPLFYDGVHYTPQGSVAVAVCVNKSLPPLRGPDPAPQSD
ncbi:MAG: hypothetical protein CBC48_05050 [bacterium TMED88]|nr:hypothetical protein [Deltaproteobacteria bacterium]OUV34917.1 MAG: hypothetical protein CBC48_05050 [bacterium TMED88]